MFLHVRFVRFRRVIYQPQQDGVTEEVEHLLVLDAVQFTMPGNVLDQRTCEQIETCGWCLSIVDGPVSSRSACLSSRIMSHIAGITTSGSSSKLHNCKALRSTERSADRTSHACSGLLSDLYGRDMVWPDVWSSRQTRVAKSRAIASLRGVSGVVPAIRLRREEGSTLAFVVVSA